MIVVYCFVASFSASWLVWWGCLVGFGRIRLSIKSLGVLLVGFAVIFAVASQVIRLSYR